MGGPKANEESDKKDTETISQSTILHVGQLTRNVSVAHLQEIFGVYGKIKNIDLAMDRVVNLPKGFAYVEYEVRADAEKAREYMNGGQLDGNVTTCNFILVPKKSEGLKDKETERVPPPPPPRRSGDRDGDRRDRDGDRRDMDRRDQRNDRDRDMDRRRRCFHQLILLTA
ncbi:hypothetical protein CYMTET_37011 [Cymbomonas tetramitiformis]|uniref:RRM domain-containing protein n=1 Tax=Cymbomonas tetramitiformis TaxID=36881 RepID=A0AAE0F6N7_9CHLO|nr:hypothetical protein CYMTET_37011 [Cymbomonas tetramitiformis]